MTDAVALLTSHHREIDGLFSQVEAQPSPGKDIVDQIVKQLSIHDAVEKEYLYPALREHLEGGDELADHAIEEHNEQAKELLAIDKADSGSPEQAKLLHELIVDVRHHVEEEESEIFPKLQQAMSGEQLEALGGKLEAGMKTAPTRPHPMAPSEGLGTKVAGAMAAPMDKLRDAVEDRNT